MSAHADWVINDEIAEQVAKIAGAVWVHNMGSTGEETMTITTPEGRSVITELKPSDVCDLIDAFLFPLMQEVHKDSWKLTTNAEFDLWLQADGLLSDYGIDKWHMLVAHISSAIDYVGYGDAKH
ncbi:TPA: hypothetical protein I8235_000975 [Kluyvera intermedia]|nr:hypothetical protein [Kluyvera intermedia]